MRKYFLSKWSQQGEVNFNLNANDINDLYEKLSKKYPNQKINLNGFNFEYITHASHCLAAGYLSNENMNISISEARSPAHFNEEFFYIIGYYEENDGNNK